MSETAQKVVFSDDLEATLRGELSARSARRVLVLAAPSRRFVDRVLCAATGLSVEVFDGARVHVPEEVVSRAAEVARGFDPDTLLTLGGGSATGLGKALRLSSDATFIAVPTTYSASERTTLYGITSGAEKKTGRSPRVRPDVVIYAPELTIAIPRRLTVQSLLNALAHPISALCAEPLEPPARARALRSIALTMSAVTELSADPTHEGGRRRAFEATALAGEVIEAGTLGVHHRIAHFLGGRFGLEHAALHSLLLVQTVVGLSTSDPRAHAEIAQSAGSSELATTLFTLLEGAGAETSLRALGVDEGALGRALAERPDLPRETVLRAFEGTRP